MTSLEPIRELIINVIENELQTLNIDEKFLLLEALRNDIVDLINNV
jgi:hypothetical protein